MAMAPDGRTAAHDMFDDDSASRALGIELLSAAGGAAVARMRVTAAMVNGHGIGHGGYVFLLADTAFACACNSHGGPTVAAGAEVTFVSPVFEGDVLLARATERVRFGRSGIYDVTVTRGDAVVAEFRGHSRTVEAAGRSVAAPGADGLASWLPGTFEHPARLDLGTGHHLRPIRASDVDVDYPAVMGSRERLWSIYGDAWGWPPATMTYEQDREDLARHEAEIESHRSFNYALFDTGETALLGCVYIDPPERVGADAEISWWVVDALVGSNVEAALDRAVPEWIARAWPFERPRYVGRDISWKDWLALPEPG